MWLSAWGAEMGAVNPSAAVPSLQSQQVSDVTAGLRDNGRRMKFVGRHYAFGQSVSAVAGTDIGGTTRKTYIAAGNVSRLQALVSTHFFANGGTGATEESTSFPRNIDQFRLGFEYPLTAGKVTLATLAGKQRWTVDPVSPITATDPVGVPIPAGGEFACRMYIKPALPPSGTGTATAVAGGSLSVSTRYYTVTRTEMGVESGPIAEFNGTTAGGNLTLRLTWVDSRSATADFYTVYFSAAAGGTKQLLARTSGPQRRLDDDGGYTPDATINPPAVSNYRFNILNVGAIECSSHVNAGGVGDDQVLAIGTFGIVGGNFKFGVVPNAIVGDDDSGRSILATGTSIIRGSGFAIQGTVYPQQLNFFDRALTDSGRTYNSCNAGYNASTLNEMIASNQQGAGRSRMLLPQFADVVLDEHGTTDLSYFLDWQKLARNKLLYGRICHTQGARFFTTTVLPKTTSTDNCLTIGNQTLTAGAWPQLRRDFNAWVRNGCQVDGSGAPVITGGTPSPDIDGCVDISAAVAVDASNVLTMDGDYWIVPSAPTYTGLVLTGSPTTTSFTTTLAAMGAAYSNVGRVIRMTSGARNGQVAVVNNNGTTTTLTLFAHGDITQSGVALTGLSGAPAAGDTFEIWDVATNEGLHPAIAGHALLSVPVLDWVLATVM